MVSEPPTGGPLPGNMAGDRDSSTSSAAGPSQPNPLTSSAPIHTGGQQISPTGGPFPPAASHSAAGHFLATAAPYLGGNTSANPIPAAGNYLGTFPTAISIPAGVNPAAGLSFGTIPPLFVPHHYNAASSYPATQCLVPGSQGHYPQNPNQTLTSYEEEEEIPIPNSLKFIMDALKILNQHPLTADNYLIWATQIESIFHANGYAQHLNPYMATPPPYLLHPDGSPYPNPVFKRWNLINRNLHASVLSTITPTIQPFVLRTATVGELWISLKTRLQSTTQSRIIQLREELHHLHMVDETMPQYLAKVKGIVDQLEASGSHLDDGIIMIYIMNGLPSSYNGFKTAIRIKDTHRHQLLLLSPYE